MGNKLTLNALTPASTVNPAPAPVAPTSSPALVQNDAADLRLVIEEDRASGMFVYKTIDRRTGDVVLQLPREEVIRMHSSGAYGAGAIIKAKA